jgi:hypothetical protein
MSPHGRELVLKGAALFTVWTGHPHRATRDLDLLGFGEPSQERLRAMFADVVRTPVPDDGVSFEATAIEAGAIRDGEEYGGVRLHLTARVATAVVRLQVDIGFGDAITPGTTEIGFPPLIDFPAPRLRAYPRETVVAEKLEALVKLGIANSRMKDFHDLAELSRLFAFDGTLLVRAIRATFERRGTPLPNAPPVAFTPDFTGNKEKRAQWSGFMRKARLKDAADLGATMAAVARFRRKAARGRRGDRGVDGSLGRRRALGVVTALEAVASAAGLAVARRSRAQLPPAACEPHTSTV